IDWLLASQLDLILHHRAFQELEAAWRGLELVVSRADFGENIRIELLNCSKEDLRVDFDGSLHPRESGLYRIVYERAFGDGGGDPFGGIVSNYVFSPHEDDIALLRMCALVGAAAHAPFLAAASPEFLGLASYAELSRLASASTITSSRAYDALREDEDS